MLSLEQVKLLESKVSRTIDYVTKVNGENTALKERLDSYQKRIDELETLVKKFKDEQSRIEEGILSALDRLNQFEDALDLKFPNEAEAIKAPEEAEEPKIEPEASVKAEPLTFQASKKESSINGELGIF